MAGPCIAVDLGATHSVVAVCRKGKVDVIANDSGSRTTPSIVAFQDGESFVGEAARDLPRHCQAFDAKRLMGRSAMDSAMKEAAKQWPFQVLQQNGALVMKVAAAGAAGKTVAPHEVTAMVAKSLKKVAEATLEQTVHRAVFTVPPYFTESQRRATQNAGTLAGFSSVSLLDEAEAAVTAYGLAGKRVLVLHVGGRSLYAWAKAPGGRAEVRHADWGGDLFDERLVDHFLQDIRAKHRIQALDVQSLQELRAACEAAKCKLSSRTEANVTLYLPRQAVQYKGAISRARFEDLCADLFVIIQDTMRDVVAASKVRSVDEVVLVGGSTRMPRVRAAVRDAFREPRYTVNPDEAVAHGAAMHAVRGTADQAAGNGVMLKEAVVPPAPPSASGASGPSTSRADAHRNAYSRPKAGAEAPAIGIDLGTTYSVVAVCRKGKVDILANDSGSRTTPSIVGFLDGESFVGDAAKDLPADRRVFDAKRLIGRPWKDLDVQADRKHWPFQIFEQNGVPRIKVMVTSGKESFAPEEISAMVLRSLKETAENFLGSTVRKAVITVPAYFNERQRQATKDAGAIAGLEVISIFNEPTSAAIAYGLSTKSDRKRTVFIFDLGGGTFDVSVLTIKGTELTVLASDGDTHLGGQDFDVRMMEHFMKDIRQRYGFAELDQQSVQDLRAACELAKRKLSKLHEAPVSVFFSRLGLRYKSSITRALFEDLCADLFRKAMTITERVLAETGLFGSRAVDDVVLVGGSTRIPKVRAMLSEFFGGKELRQSINPDEAVAYGAAVHAAGLTGDNKFMDKMVKLKDVTPLSLGINTLGGRFSVIIPRNSQIPCEKTASYCTVDDYQSVLGSTVYQGERALSKDNHCLNKKFEVPVPPRPRGQSEMDVTFKIDADGLLTVTAVEPTTGARQRVTISRSDAALDQGDIDDMVARARRLRKDDDDEVARLMERLRIQRPWLHY